MFNLFNNDYNRLILLCELEGFVNYVFIMENLIFFVLLIDNKERFLGI